MMSLEQLGDLTPPPRRVLEVALDVLLSAPGKYERPEDEQDADVKYLRGRLHQWKPSTDLKVEQFDRAVLRVIIETLRIADPSPRSRRARAHR
jgi:hypothetical protein